MLECGAIDHHIGVEQHEIDLHAKPNQPAVGEPEARAAGSEVIFRIASWRVTSGSSRTWRLSTTADGAGQTFPAPLGHSREVFPKRVLRRDLLGHPDFTCA